MNTIFQLENYAFNIHSLPFFISGMIALTMGIFVFIHDVRSPVHRSFLYLCAGPVVWLIPQGFTFMSLNPETAFFWERITYVGVSLTSVTVYEFTIEWLGGGRVQRLLLKIGYFLGFLSWPFILFTPWIVSHVKRMRWGYYSQFSEPGSTFFLLFFAFYVFAVFRNFIVAYRKEPPGIRRNQLLLLIIAFFIAFASAIDVLPSYGVDTYPIGYATILVFIMTIAYCIIRYRLMDIQTVVHRTTMWLLSTVVAIFPFALFIYGIQGWPGTLPLPVSTLFSLGLLLGFYFYFRAMQPWLDHLFRRRRANLQLVLSQFSGELVHLKNLRDLLQGVTRLLRRTLYVGKVSIYLKDAKKNELIPAIVKRLRGVPPVTIDHPFLKWLERRDTVVIANLIQSDPEVRPFKEALLDYFSKMEASVAVPLVLGGSLIGVIHLGKKDNLKKYFSEEIQFLSQLKSPVTIAFSNSLQLIAMQEKLKKWNEELEKKVTERTHQLQTTQAQLVQAEKLATVGTLAGGVAHEIGNPLTAVLTNAQILKFDATPDALESISLIEQGARRCQAIIQKLMKYARKPAEMEVAEKVNLNKVAASAIAFLEFQLEQDNVDLVMKKASSLAPVEGNSNELEQVLTNLILNAKDAVKQTSGEGRIKVETFEKNGCVGFSVTDNGMGIPSENLPKIFDPFFTTKDIGKGTGLGLAVTFGIVEKHKGRIEVQSEVGKGTAFTVTLPRGSV